MTQRDQVFGIERERGLEHRLCLDERAVFKQRLPEDNVPTHVARLLGQVLSTQRDGLRQIARLAVFVRKRRKVATRVFVELAQ
jgi:hypothetical protein